MSEQKQRHGCLTTVLVLMIVTNSATALMYLLGRSAFKQSLGMPSWVLVVMGVLASFNLACAIALFKWKKWGFWGFIASCIVALFVNISAGIVLGQSLLGPIGIALLYGVLHIGKENKGWPQLD